MRVVAASTMSSTPTVAAIWSPRVALASRGLSWASTTPSTPPTTTTETAAATGHATPWLTWSV